MVKLTIDENRCKGCGLCVRACPKKLLELAKQKLNEKGYHPAMMTDPVLPAQAAHAPAPMQLSPLKKSRRKRTWQRN